MARGCTYAEVRRTFRPLLVDLALDQPPGDANEVVRVTPDYEVAVHELLSNDGKIVVAGGLFGVADESSMETQACFGRLADRVAVAASTRPDAFPLEHIMTGD